MYQHPKREVPRFEKKVDVPVSPWRRSFSSGAYRKNDRLDLKVGDLGLFFFPIARLDGDVSGGKTITNTNRPSCAVWALMLERGNVISKIQDEIRFTIVTVAKGKKKYIAARCLCGDKRTRDKSMMSIPRCELGCCQGIRLDISRIQGYRYSKMKIF